MSIYGNEIITVTNEIAVIRKGGFLIEIDKGLTEYNFMQDPYFKIYNSESQNKASMMARISMKAPKYIHHKSLKDNWILSATDKKKMILLFTEVTNGRSGWENLFDNLNKLYNSNIVPWEIPDYRKLK